MRAFLKFMFVVMLAVAFDRVACAPQRYYHALLAEARDDWPRCMREVAERTAELCEQRKVGCGENGGEAVARFLECHEQAEREHHQQCPRSHLADQLVMAESLQFRRQTRSASPIN